MSEPPTPGKKYSATWVGKPTASGVTPDNYAEKSFAYAKKRGECSMLKPGEHEAQLKAWRMYFINKGDQVRHRAVTMILSEKGVYATPAEWPWEFDADYNQ